MTLLFSKGWLLLLVFVANWELIIACVLYVDVCYWVEYFRGVDEDSFCLNVKDLLQTGKLPLSDNSAVSVT